MFARFLSGLFPASSAGESAASSGYANVWVRGNVYVAFAHQVSTHAGRGGRRARPVMFFSRHRRRFEAIIAGEVDPEDVSKRPHVRLDGHRLEEISHERWSHAQNDALGYFVWLYARLARARYVALHELEVSTLALFPQNFAAIRFWQDPDSGHWEEARKSRPRALARSWRDSRRCSLSPRSGQMRFSASRLDRDL